MANVIGLHTSPCKAPCYTIKLTVMQVDTEYEVFFKLLLCFEKL